MTELEQLRAELENVKGERDAAIKEANRRDQKWMDGINEAVGRKLDYSDPSSNNNASKALGELASRLREAERKAAEDGTVTLTVDQIKQLAEFSGLTVHGEITEYEKETEITVCPCPDKGVEDDDHSVKHYRHIAYFDEIPDDGVFPLGDALTPPPQTTTGGVNE